MDSVRCLLEVMARLRNPETGCPWDLKQDFKSISSYTLEEAYEVVDAIERCDYPDLCDELGDLLLQVVYHARIAAERGLFDFEDVVRSVTAKMVRRHPHVFGDFEPGDDAELSLRWEDDKARSRRRRGRHGVFDGIARNLPALRVAHKLQQRAADRGFNWRHCDEMLNKLDEELAEVRNAVASGDLEEEIGDLLFTVVNLSRHFSIDAEYALRQANRKFERRFSRVVEKLRSRLKAQERDERDVSVEELDTLWDEVKNEEHKG